MKQWVKKTVAGFASAALVFGSAGILPDGIFDGFGIVASAAETGTCGENLTWTLDEAGTLTISGNGPMADYDNARLVPWYSVSSKIKKVLIEEGVTYIGKCSFSYLTGLSEVIIPKSLITIGEAAFYDCDAIISIDIPENVETIGKSAFGDCEGIAELTIPDSVKTISENAFRYCFGLTTVFIGNNVTTISDSAFFNCLRLTSLTLGNNVRTISNKAFNACHRLVTVNIPADVAYIDPDAFGSCERLVSINVDENNNNYSSVDGVLFNKDKSVIIRYPEGKKQNRYVIPDSITTIGDNAFYQCSGIQEIVIPENVTEIGMYAFYKCSGIKEIVVPDKVTTIGKFAFSNCENLLNVVLPESLTEISSCLFRLSTALESVNIPSSVRIIGNQAFGNCTSLKSIYISENVESLDIGYMGVFPSCTSLKEINVSDKNKNYSSIDGVLFNKDKTVLMTYPGGREELYTVPDGTETIDKVAFKGAKISEVVIPESVKLLDYGTFYYCKALKSVVIPDSVKTIERYAFAYSSSLVRVYIPSGVTSINYGVFDSCTSLKGIYYAGSESQWKSIKSDKLELPGDCIVYYNYSGEELLPAESISVTAPVKTEYYTGDEFDPTGLSLKVKYSDGYEKEIAVTSDMLSGFDNTSSGKQTITVTYEKLTDTFEVDVKKPSITGITASAPEKTTYYVGEDLDLSGSSLLVNYNNGSAEKVDITDKMISGYDKSTLGKQTITVTYEGFTDTFEVTVNEKPTAIPPTVTAASGDGQVTLSWDAVPGATKYAVSIYENGKYTVLNQKLAATSYTAKNLTNGKEYQFLVQSYVGKWSSKSTKYLVMATPVSTAPVVTLTAGDGQVTLKWEAVPGATKYAVSTYENGKYTVLTKTLTGTTYTAKKLTNGKEYQFLVQSYNGKWSSASTDLIVSATPVSSKPTVTATAGDGQVTLSWNAVTNATKYAVSIYENGKYTVLNKTLTGTTYTAKKLTNGKEYQFLVQSYNGKWSSASTDLLVSATPVSTAPVVTLTAGDGQVTLKWSAVNGATKYAVSIYENGKYTVLSKTITGTTYTAKKLTNSKEYQFLVQAYVGKWSSASTDLLVSATPKA